MPIIQVAGNVASVRSTTSGWTIIKTWEKVEFKGQEKFILWTSWFDNQAVAMGIQEHDELIIEGRLSTKIGSWTDKENNERTAVEHHLNECTIKQHKPKQPPKEDVWANTDSEAPF